LAAQTEVGNIVCDSRSSPVSEVPCLQAGDITDDITDDMYPVPAVYQRIFNQ